MSSKKELVDPQLLELLVCPIDHGNLEVFGEALRCATCGRLYPVVDGIPNMIVEDA